MLRGIASFVALAVALGACTCDGGGTTSASSTGAPPASSKPASLAPGEPWPVAALVLDRVHYGFTLEYAGEPKAGPEVEFHALRSRSYPSLLVQPKPTEDGPTPAAFMRLVGVAQGTYTPPRRERVAAAQKGLSDADIDALAQAKAAMSITFFATRSNFVSTLHDASSFVADIAETTGAIVFDETTHLRFSAAAFRADRAPPGAPVDVPRAAANLLVNAYERGGVPRAITRGMGKLGLPDLALEGAPTTDAAVELLDLVAQTLAECGKLDDGGALPIDVRALREGELRASLLAASAPNAKGAATVRLLVAKRAEGEPERLAEIAIPGPSSVPARERVAALLAELFGAR